jgi:hypothetical protein
MDHWVEAGPLKVGVAASRSRRQAARRRHHTPRMPRLVSPTSLAREPESSSLSRSLGLSLSLSPGLQKRWALNALGLGVSSRCPSFIPPRLLDDRRSQINDRDFTVASHRSMGLRAILDGSGREQLGRTTFSLLRWALGILSHWLI